MNSAFAILLFFYYNQVLGLSGTLCGLALMIATAIDAVTDPVMGTVSDNLRSSFGRRHPFMYASSLPLAVSFYFLFDPAVGDESGLFIWLTCFSIMTRMSMTLFHVPHLAFGAELSEDFDVRTKLVAYRMLFGVSGWIILNVGFANFFAATDEYPNGQLNPINYPPFAAILSLGIFISIVATSLGTHKVIPFLHNPSDSTHYGFKLIFRDLQNSLRNVSFRWLVIAYMLGSIPATLVNSLSLYVNTFYWELSPSQIPGVLLAGSIATLIGYAAAPWASKYMDKRTLLMTGAATWAIANLSPFALRFLGFYPPTDSLWNLSILIAFAAIAGAGLAQIVVCVSSMIADVADEHEVRHERRNEGVFFGVFSFCGKASSGAGVAMAGLLIDLIKWPVGSTIKTASDIPESTLTMLALICGPGAVLIVLPVFYCMTRYNIDRTRHKEIQEELTRKKAEKT